ncbi:von Willebrand factor C domain-containing protein 2-like [Nibea albiflora]|uniref:von Willebrand factor C domain-containing protein 2-like n=1 Tax=Nibea albiflora TaxID=240163 RepID=A0ACB7FMA7_NIBAL|nr:von Willebrand factor C domain-containing protein 2-like [Nibea albiflora]
MRTAVLALLLCAQAGFGFSVAGQQESTCEANGSIYFVGECHYPTDCCPRCEKIGCEYRGVVYELGQNFQPSECEQCTCDSDGIARCLVADCAPPPCVNPVYQPGKCCPECKDGPNCYVNASRTQVIPAGEPIWVDSCTKCRCHDGQDAGYWEGNRLATCSRLKNCTPEQPSAQKN